MSVTHTIERRFRNGTDTILGSNDVASGSAIVIDEALPSNQTNLQVALAFTVAKLKSIYIYADVAMTLKTNSSGSPQETISLLASTPYVWVYGDGYFSAPFAGNVSTLYVTNTTAGTLQIRAIVDPT